MTVRFFFFCAFNDSAEAPLCFPTIIDLIIRAFHSINEVFALVIVLFSLYYGGIAVNMYTR